MARTKKKEESGLSKRTIPARSSRIVKSSEVRSSQAEELLGYWQEEVAALSRDIFPSEEAALNTLMDRVLTRLRMPEHLVAPTREFLETLFATDPALMETIRKTMRIKSP